MNKRTGLTDNQVAKLEVRNARYFYPDPLLIGHYIRIQPTGSKTFVATARDPYRKQIWHTIGSTGLHTIDEARDLARDAIKRIQKGKPAVEPTPAKPDSYETVARNWLKREAQEFRTKKEIERVLDKYILPLWASRDFVAIKRSDVASLLDKIEDNHGPRQADIALALIRSVANWYATRDGDYVSPIVKGMRRGKRVSRDRILTDAELRTVWQEAGRAGTFGAFVRILILTAQRRDIAVQMRWDDISKDGVWTIPKEDRSKGNLGAVKLPAEALAIIKAQPKIAGNPYVFAVRSDGPLRGLGKFKNRFAESCNLSSRWTLHDLRRTGRSLMSKGGVPSDIAERVLGHVRPGVEKIYDRYSYEAEKSQALKRLAAMVGEVVHADKWTNDPFGKVVKMKTTKARARA